MTDRELLELAAKAAGVVVQWDNEGTAWLKWPSFKWNPMEDDGDALRLAVKLKITVTQPDEPGDADEVGAWTGRSYIWIKRGNDPAATTRRAIVRAAAAIGKAM